MKAQTKALVASVAVIALALSAVSGITYSWWSDSENSEIDISTGSLDVSTSGFKILHDGEEIYGNGGKIPATLSMSYGGTTNVDVQLDGQDPPVDPDDAKLRIVYDVTFTATVKAQYLINVNVPAGITAETEIKLGDDVVDICGKYQYDTTGELEKTYSVTVEIDKLAMNVSGKFSFTNYITQYANSESSGSADVKSNEATVTDDTTGASVKASSLPNNASTLNVVITTDESVSNAFINLILKDSSSEKITDFSSPVKIEVVLEGTYNGLYFNGEGEQPVGITYDYSETGKTKITFETSHFSEFVAVQTVEISDESALRTAIAAGGYVKLTGDITISETLAVTGNVVLDLNGKKINNTAAIWSDNNWSLISVRSGGELIMTGNGTLEAMNGDCYGIDIQNGKCTIQNGTINGNISAVYLHPGKSSSGSWTNPDNEKAELIIYGGEYQIQQTSPTTDPYGFMINSIDAAYKAKASEIAIYGGSFKGDATYGFNPQNCKAEGENTNFCAVGYVSKKTSENPIIWSVVPAEAKIGNTYYNTLEDAMGKVNENDIVEVLSDVEVESTITIDKAMTLNLNWNTISANIQCLIDVKANLTVTDGTLVNGATGSQSSQVRVIQINGDGVNIELSLDNVYIEAPTKTYNRGISVGADNSTVVVNVNGGRIYADHYSLFVAENTGTKAEFIVLGATIEGYGPIETYSPNTTMTITNCQILGINNYSGEIDSNTTIALDSTATGSSIKFTNCTIEATQTQGSQESFLYLACAGSTVSMDGCKYVWNGNPIELSVITANPDSYVEIGSASMTTDASGKVLTITS